MPKTTSTSACCCWPLPVVRPGAARRAAVVISISSGCSTCVFRYAIRPGRLCEKPAQVQSTIAFARSSPVESSARCTAPQASEAVLPFIVRPPRNCTTAAPRPIVAIVPLSLYSNGFVSSPFNRRAMFSPAHSPDCSATEPSCGRVLSVSVIQAMSPTANTSGWPARLRSGPTGTRLPRSQIDAERLDDRSRLQAGAPDERVRVKHGARLQRHARGRDGGHALADEDVDAALLRAPSPCSGGGSA